MSNFPLRLPKDLMADAKSLAKDQGVSVNQFMATVLAERVGEMKATRHFIQRSQIGDPAAALAIMLRAPDRPPMPGDELAQDDRA